MKIIVDTMFSRIDFEGNTLLQEQVQDKLHLALGVKEDGAIFSRAYKSGVWDGVTDFYNKKEDQFHTGLLPQVLKAVRELQDGGSKINYEIEDNRPPSLVHPDSIDESIELGNGDEPAIHIIKDEKVRGYQHTAIQQAFREQVGIINVATNGGKCLTEDSTLLTSEGLMTVGEFFKRAGHTTEDKEDVIPYEGRVSLINRYGLSEKPSNLTFNGSKPVLEITGHRGTKNKITANHPLLTVQQDGNFEWKQAQEIQEGDILVGRVGDHVYGHKTTVSGDEAYAIGAIIADGYIGQDEKITMVSAEKEIIQELETYLSSLVDGQEVYHDKHQKGAYSIALFNKKAVKEWHQRLGIGYGVAKNKSVPSCVLTAPKKVQLAFLSGYLESECSINNQKGCIDVTSASSTLINQLNLMLRNMGFVPTVRERKVKGYEQSYYVLALGCTDSIDLINSLDFISEKRHKQVENFMQAVSTRTRNNKKEKVPHGKELVEKYVKTYKNKPKGMGKACAVPNSISKTRVRDILRKYPDGDPELLRILSLLSSKRRVFEEVTSVQHVGVRPTFDVCMPTTHSFMAEGIINHNTEIAAGIIQQVLPYLERGERVGFFTSSKEIFHQSAERIAKRLNLDPRDIGKIGDGKFQVKNKQVVFVMIPTLNSALKDPKQGVKFTHKDRVIKLIAEDIAPKFNNTKNTRQLLRNYIKNCKLTTKVWQSAEEHLQYIAYDNSFTDSSAQMQLNKYKVEFDKILEKKNEKKFKKHRETMDFINSVKVLLADEVHHTKSETWFESLSKCTEAGIRIGLTGTVDKKDKMLWQRLQGLFGEIILKVSNDYLIERGISSKPTIRMIPIMEPKNIELIDNYLEAYRRGIVENDIRNAAVAKLALGYRMKKSGGVLISVNQHDHGNRIKELLLSKGQPCEFVHGELADEDRARLLKDFGSGELPILIASSIIDEGVDLKSIGCMILAAGGKSMRQQLQRIGRGLRLNGIDGNSVMVFDFMDRTNKHLYKHAKERVKLFKNENFDVKIAGE